MREVDLENRDPNELNAHIKVQFEDVLGEPDGAHSVDCIWSNSYKCFECGKALCYKLMTLFCGICIALGWGCDFALTAFLHVWIYTPFMRDCGICIACVRKVYALCIDCYCGPICEVCGLCLSKIKVTKA